MMQQYINIKYQDLIKTASELSSEYVSGQPFPNIQIENFFDQKIMDCVLAEFPNLDQRESISYSTKNELKFAGKGELFFGKETKRFMNYLNSEPFINFLQILTGIEEPLIGDPYYEGGGQHEIKKGGFLKIHADFNKHKRLKLDRRLNVLIYLNKNWKESYGGHFELWNKSMTSCEKRILPSFNTIAIFSTNDFSYHGHPDPLDCPEDMSRKSLALYYYTNGRPASEIQKGLEEHSTLFKSRPLTDDSINNKSMLKKDRLKHIVKLITPPILITAATYILKSLKL